MKQRDRRDRCGSRRGGAVRLIVAEPRHSRRAARASDDSGEVERRRAEENRRIVGSNHRARDQHADCRDRHSHQHNLQCAVDDATVRQRQVVRASGRHRGKRQESHSRVAQVKHARVSAAIRSNTAPQKRRGVDAVRSVVDHRRHKQRSCVARTHRRPQDIRNRHTWGRQYLQKPHGLRCVISNAGRCERNGVVMSCCRSGG